MILHAARSIVFAASILATSVAAQPAAAPHLKAKVTLKAEAILPEQGFSDVTGAALLPDGVIVVLYAGGRSINDSILPASTWVRSEEKERAQGSLSFYISKAIDYEEQNRVYYMNLRLPHNLWPIIQQCRPLYTPCDDANSTTYCVS